MTRHDTTPHLATYEQLLAMSHEELVRYCNSLWTPEAAVDVLLGCVSPSGEHGDKADPQTCSECGKLISRTATRCNSCESRRRGKRKS